MLKRIISLIIAFLMLLTFPLNVFADTNDYSNHWAKNIIDKWKHKEIIKGYEDGGFKPENEITRAEFAQILVRIFGYKNFLNSVNYNDVSTNDWFYNAVSLVSYKKLMYDFNENEFRPNEKTTREEAIYAIAKAYKIIGNTDKKFKDEDDISSWAKESINAMRLYSYINGTPNGYVMPRNFISRAELLIIIDNITKSLINEKGIYQEDVDGNLVVNTKDVELKNMTINGNLYLAAGIGDGNVTLDNITVKGNVIIEGGGENSIKSKKSNYYKSFIVNADNPVRLVVEGDAVKVEVNPRVNITLSGNFSEVNISPDTRVQLSSATIDKINVLRQNQNETFSTVNIIMDKESKVTTVTVDSSVYIAGQGTITNANINVMGVVIEQKVKNVTVAYGLIAEVGGKTIVNPITGGGGVPSAPTPTVPTPTDPVLDEKYYITGTVVDETGNSISNAFVYINRNSLSYQTVTDKDGRFSFYVYSNISYSIYAEVVGENDYGYMGRVDLQKLTANVENIKVEVKKSPVLVYSAVDKNGVPIGDITVYNKDNQGNNQVVAIIGYVFNSNYPGDNNIAFLNDSNSYFYVIKDFSSGKEIKLENVEKEVKKIDEYKTEIKLVLKDYGYDTSITGRINPIDDMNLEGRIVNLAKFKIDEHIGEVVTTLTDKNGYYTFENIDTKNYLYELKAEDVFYNEAWYVANYVHECRVYKDINFIKSHAINFSAVDKNGISIKGVKFKYFMYGLWIKDELNHCGVKTCIFGYINPGTYTLEAKVTVNGEEHLSVGTINILDGVYKPYDCVMKFDTYEVPKSELRTVSGYVSYITPGGAITGSAITADMINNTNISIINVFGNVIKTVRPSMDGSYKIENLINDEYFLEAEIIYEGIRYTSFRYPIYTGINIFKDILIKIEP
jgi:hypothetical protein